MGKIKNLPEDWFTRSVIASSPTTSQDTIAELANDKDWRVLLQELQLQEILKHQKTFLRN